MGRLWQTLILSRWQPVLAYLPVETVIKRRQQAYYDQLAAADAQADCSNFIEFILTAIEESLREAPELSIPQLAASLGKSQSAVERAIRKLREAGRLKRIGPDKGGHWQVLDEFTANRP